MPRYGLPDEREMGVPTVGSHGLCHGTVPASRLAMILFVTSS